MFSLVRELQDRMCELEGYRHHPIPDEARTLLFCSDIELSHVEADSYR